MSLIRRGPGVRIDDQRPQDRRALLLAARLLEQHARFMKVFATHNGEWSKSEGGKLAKEEHDECMRVKRYIERMAAFARLQPDGSLELTPQGDI